MMRMIPGVDGLPIVAPADEDERTLAALALLDPDARPGRVVVLHVPDPAAGAIMRFGWGGTQPVTLNDAQAICALPQVQQAAQITGDSWSARLRAFLRIVLTHFSDDDIERLAAVPLVSVVPKTPASL